MNFKRRIITKTLDLLNLQRHNDNYAEIETDLTGHNNRLITAESELVVQDRRITNHEGSQVAHAAEHITYDGAVVGAKNLKDAVDKQKQAVDTLVVNGDSSPAAAQAKIDTFGVDQPTLKDRLDKDYLRTAAQLAETADNLIGRGVNVKYPPSPLIGVKGDGVTNDHAAFQTLLDSGTEFFVPDGTYIINGDLVLKNNTSFRGQSRYNTILKFGPGYGLKNSTGSTFNSIENIRIIGTEVGGAFSGIGIDLSESENVYLTDIYVTNFAKGLNLFRAFATRIRGARIFNNTTGVYETQSYASSISDSDIVLSVTGLDTTDISISDIEIEFCSDAALNVRGGNVRATNLYIEGSLNAVRLNNIAHLAYVNGYISGCTNAFVDSGSNATGYLYVSQITLNDISGYHFNIPTISQFRMETIRYTGRGGELPSGNNVYDTRDGVEVEVKYTSKGALYDFKCGQPSVGGFPFALNVADVLFLSITAQTVPANTLVELSFPLGVTYNAFNVKPEMSFNGSAKPPAGMLYMEPFIYGTNLYLRILNTTSAAIAHPALGFGVNFIQKQRP
ncbi:glycosyl hydrolase family 28-related protein [Paenibacillus sp. NPDC058177]|uniref:glycosyl hydrolase family 28-related protein n=1 Tax=Paenibacillus sp. NPDC058177 TaxID=3346369 RepID=UPI0036D8C425